MLPLAPSRRRADLDWLRVGAFGLLILYHVGLVYAPWEWHVNSAHRVDGLRYAALALNPWRLTLLFLVSGAALAFMAAARTPGEALRARLARLCPPLVFGVLVLAPPQGWAEAVDKGAWSGDLLAWWVNAFTPAGLRQGLPLNHVWFVLYIAVYSVAALGLAGAAPAALQRFRTRAARALAGWRLLAFPLLYLLVVRALWFGWFGITNNLFSDWYNHAASLAVFLFGFLLARAESVWRDFERLRWASLTLALAALPGLVAFEGRPGGVEFYVRVVLFAAVQWAAVAALLGFASRHLRAAGGPALRYLTDAVFPCYLAHQTILVLTIFLLKRLSLPAPAEAALLLTATLGGSLGVYEAVRRVGVLRPLWGLKPQAAPHAASPAPAAQPVRASVAEPPRR